MGWHSWKGGRRSYRKKDAPVLDSDDIGAASLSPATIPPDNVVSSGVEELKDSVLNECLNDLYKKRGPNREYALREIAEEFNSHLQHEFIENMYATLLYQCLNSIKKGYDREINWAAHVIGLLALTTGPGEKAQKILEESVSPISEALKTRVETYKTSSLLQSLAVISFVGGEEPEEIEKSMQIMWQVCHPKLGLNVAATKPSPALITVAISSWSFLLTTMDGWTLNPESWQESMSYFSTVLDNDNKLLRIAAGEALALIFEMGSLKKFYGETKVSSGSPNNEGNDCKQLMHINGLKNKVLNQVRDLSAEAGGKGSSKKGLNNQRNTFGDILDFLEAGGKGSSKKGLNNQRNTFGDILDFLEDAYTPETSIKIGALLLKTSTWAELIQLNFLKRFLGPGFLKHMQENQFLHDVFGFTPKKKLLSGLDKNRMSQSEKRMYKSPNSGLNKARTQLLNKQRTLSQDKNVGRYAVGFDDE